MVGADRIAANGDVANKIGTYSRGRAGPGERRAVLRRGARLHLRPRDAVRRRDPDRGARRRRRSRTTAGGAWPPKACRVRNPAFDVTPAPLRHRDRLRARRGARRPTPRACAAALDASAPCVTASSPSRPPATRRRRRWSRTAAASSPTSSRPRPPLHAPYGGVVPELASRHHLENICPVIEQAMARRAARRTRSSTRWR